MNSRFARCALVVGGLLMLSGGVEKAAVSVPVDDGIIPVWALRQSAPSITDQQHKVTGVSASTSSDGCLVNFELQLPIERVAVRADSTKMITEMYCRNGDGFIERFDVAADLTHTADTIPIDHAATWQAADLDLDGDVELISQWGSVLKIHSATSGTLRASFGWTGANVSMHPAVVNLDEDSYLEVWATPNDFAGSRAILIKYNEVTDGFDLIADIVAPLGAIGETAIGDFDEDGRVEFIAGYYDFGYSLFEWQDPNLVFIGQVGDTLSGNNFYATACRPKLGGALHALVGHSSGGAGLGYLFQLLEAESDNIFTVTHRFQDYTGWFGVHPSQAADVDCDGLDELAMGFFPSSRVYEWNVGLGEFVRGCEWDIEESGSLVSGRTVDLDWNGANEWGSLGGSEKFRTLPAATCLFCDGTGTCNPDAVTCFCYCAADPACDGVTNVVDVVHVVNVAFRGA